VYRYKEFGGILAGFYPVIPAVTFLLSYLRFAFLFCFARLRECRKFPLAYANSISCQESLS
jgi:hypothetical protein